MKKRKVLSPIYHIICDDCDAMYVGETEISLKTGFLEHQRKSNVGSQVSQHVQVDRPEHGVSLDKVNILTVENSKFERVVKDAIYFRVAKTSLNKESGRYLLPAVWTNLLTAWVQASPLPPVPGPPLKLRSPT